MSVSSRASLFYNEAVLAHQPDPNAAFLPGRLDKRVRQMLAGLGVPWQYPEHPGRINAVLDYLRQHPLEGLGHRTAPPATREQLGRVHTTAYLDHLFSLRGQSAWLDVDTTAVSPGSIEAAEAAAGLAIAAVEAVFDQSAESAFALVRPPGHHAESVRARGFCLFNNVAVAASHAMTLPGCERVLIIDWDAHHGNGTQEIFHADPDVMFFDIHRAAPFYPGTGHLEEVGVGMGEGTTINVPLPGGSGDLAFLAAIDDILAPAAAWFRPDLILVSAGFDAHWNDMALNVSYDGFAAMTERVRSLAEQHCDGRLAMVLEGGYNLESLSRAVHSVLSVLCGASVALPEAAGLAAARAAADYHRAAFEPDD